MHWHVPSLTVSSKNLSHTLVDLITTDNPFGLDHTDYPNGKFMDQIEVQFKIKYKTMFVCLQSVRR